MTQASYIDPFGVLFPLVDRFSKTLTIEWHKQEWELTRSSLFHAEFEMIDPYFAKIDL